jgi:hypothetical protein
LSLREGEFTHEDPSSGRRRQGRENKSKQRKAYLDLGLLRTLEDYPDDVMIYKVLAVARLKCCWVVQAAWDRWVKRENKAVSVTVADGMTEIIIVWRESEDTPAAVWV